MADDQSKLKFLAKLDELFNSGTHSDLTIVAGNTAQFHVHKALIGLRTSFFTNATKPENGFSEAKDNVVTIQEHSAHAVWRFLTYCYSGDYKDGNNTELSEEDDHPSLKHPRVYALADMLDIPDLKDLITKKLQIQLNNWVAADFPVMVREIYSTTNKQDKEIRNVLVTTAKEHIDKLLKLKEFKEVAEEFGEFSTALLAVVREPPPPPVQTIVRCSYGYGGIADCCDDDDDD
ncbi:hypothetical protein BDD12DRAFT_878711 [Trichophaea hybrida]|nr:hypothetical protein BDD12DRAFT_878711 [Trichophaea hybrida]